ncbi:MAG: hypothetical protein CSA15_00120 [Candidatus Delongbacteria bacterium]|nr:MAG: hypothetical protein CSA15_00120 [Candidatus Delongbacteria bacterium]
MKYIKRVALKGTELEKASCKTIRNKLFKIGASIIKNSRKLKIYLSSCFPLKELFNEAWRKLQYANST